jgi:hypothetical protein
MCLVTLIYLVLVLVLWCGIVRKERSFLVPSQCIISLLLVVDIPYSYLHHGQQQQRKGRTDQQQQNFILIVHAKEKEKDELIRSSKTLF